VVATYRYLDIGLLLLANPGVRLKNGKKIKFSANPVNNKMLNKPGSPDGPERPREERGSWAGVADPGQ
jgi:hypothetical protein